MSANGNAGGGSTSPTPDSNRLLSLPAAYRPTEQTRATYFPEVVDDDWQPLTQAPGYNSNKERNVFNSTYDTVAQQYFQASIDDTTDGQDILQMFERWKAVVEAFTLASLRLDAVDNRIGATLSASPQGGQQAALRAIRQDTITNFSYEQTVDATGQFNIFPDENAGNNTYAVPAANEQAFIIFGFIELNAEGTAPYDYLQYQVQDSQGVYQPNYVRHKVANSNSMAVIELTDGPILGYPDIGVDVDVNAVETNVTTGLIPVGFEVVVGNASNSGGILG